MYTAEALIDIHAKTHASLEGLLDHCDGFSADELSRELEGFGYPTILLQLHHMIGAEQYWLGVLQGQMLVDEHDEDRASIDALRKFRERVVQATQAHLRGASDADCNQSREVTTWGNKQTEVVPALVVLRTQMHVFQHKGQVTAMARLLGRPVPAGLDFPLRAS